MNQLPYNKTSKESILEYAEKLKNKTFRKILESNQKVNENESKSLYDLYNTTKSKGSLGNLIEEHYFMYKPNSNSKSDFSEAGIELKVSPYVKRSNGTLAAKERLVLDIINYEKIYSKSFEASDMYKKCALMLLIYYLYEPKKERLDYIIKYIKLFNFPKEDLEIIKDDYTYIIDKIRAGKAHELSEGDTYYLGACTKGANASSVRSQPYSNIKAKQRAFCLKQSYMTYILNNHIVNDSKAYEPIIKNSNILKKITFQDYIISRLSKYYGQDIEFLKTKFRIQYQTSNKGFTYLLAKGMLGVLNEKIEEFEKANIQIKAIRIDKNNMPKEAMSFPTFKYNDIINETWEDSELYEMFSTTKYLFMIYQYNDMNTLIFKKAMFWSVPKSDLDSEIKKVWEETVKRIKANKYNNLPKSSESRILHVRPHGLNSKDVYPTPDGKAATKKCFWLNKKYVKAQIESGDI
jgi:DNA mismatch repair protein MutH